MSTDYTIKTLSTITATARMFILAIGAYLETTMDETDEARLAKAVAKRNGHTLTSFASVAHKLFQAQASLSKAYNDRAMTDAAFYDAASVAAFNVALRKAVDACDKFASLRKRFSSTVQD